MIYGIGTDIVRIERVHLEFVINPPKIGKQIMRKKFCKKIETVLSIVF